MPIWICTIHLLRVVDKWHSSGCSFIKLKLLRQRAWGWSGRPCLLVKEDTWQKENHEMNWIIIMNINQIRNNRICFGVMPFAKTTQCLFWLPKHNHCEVELPKDLWKGVFFLLSSLVIIGYGAAKCAGWVVDWYQDVKPQLKLPCVGPPLPHNTPHQNICNLLKLVALSIPTPNCALLCLNCKTLARHWYFMSYAIS